MPGTAEGNGAAGAHRHVYWCYDDSDDFAAVARAFLAEGMAANLRVWHVCAESDDHLTDGLPGFEEARRHGAALVSSVATTYPAGGLGDPAAQVQAFARATEDAVAAGFAGLRVVADCTSLVRTPAQVEAFARYEHLVDRYMINHPVSGLCAYDRRQLDRPTLALLACLHPIANDDSVPFRLYASPPEAGAAKLTGELDVTSRELLPAALRHVEPRVVEGRIVIDASDLSFVDHRALLTLAAHARGRGATAVLRIPSPVAGRMVELLGLPDMQMEPVT